MSYLRKRSHRIKDCPYTENDHPNPINIYGKIKREGELRLLEQLPTACIIRLSCIFGRTDNNFISSVFDQLHKQKHIDAIDDQIGSATYNRDLARALVDLSFHIGVFHFASRLHQSPPRLFLRYQNVPTILFWILRRSLLLLEENREYGRLS